jgi:hypothetical protein
MLKLADKRLSKLGFKKIKENEHGAFYERYINEFKYTQVLHIASKESGYHLIMSYDKDLFDKNFIGNVGVGLTLYEAKIALRKAKELGFKIKK